MANAHTHAHTTHEGDTPLRLLVGVGPDPPGLPRNLQVLGLYRPDPGPRRTPQKPTGPPRNQQDPAIRTFDCWPILGPSVDTIRMVLELVWRSDFWCKQHCETVSIIGRHNLDRDPPFYMQTLSYNGAATWFGCCSETWCAGLIFGATCTAKKGGFHHWSANWS